MNMMEVDGYKAKIEYDPELDQFRGEILGLNGSADFYGETPASLRKEFKNSLKVYLEVCEEKGVEPIKNYSGKFNLRIPSRLHREIAARATAADKSINEWILETLKLSVTE
ncbi:MAG: type II toxin-antitoxin system HicB family antitoxin [Ectothiorhodospiraceae bacterium]|nr:type II toxin-antitoxin system HicB family antitoxin [Ectothiorhodospiraceae bacterium]